MAYPCFHTPPLNEMQALSIERRTLLKVWRRIVPLMALVLLCGYLDRVNIGFAAVTMNHDLKLSNTAFGAASGLFAVGYALFGIPSTMMLRRFGARRWISFTMVAWGLCSAATAFVSSSMELLGVRLLLGAAEAGFFPGVIFYLSTWFPDEYRGRVLGSYFAIAPLGFVVGGPLSSMLLSWDGVFGLAGWQWLFIVEALPTILLAVIVFCVCSDRPADAYWLEPAERDWLCERLATEQRQIKSLPYQAKPWSAFVHPRVLLLTFVYLALGTSGIGAVYFLPLIIHSMGFSITHTGLVAAAPAVAAAVAMPLWGVWTDRTHNRSAVVAVASCTVVLGLLSSGVLFPAPSAILGLSLVMMGFYGFVAPFWTLPSAMLTSGHAAMGIAFITVVGNLSNLSGPLLFGWVSDRVDSYAVGLLCLAGIAAVPAALMAAQSILHRRAMAAKLALSNDAP